MRENQDLLRRIVCCVRIGRGGKNSERVWDLNRKLLFFQPKNVIEPIELSYATQIVLSLKKSVIDDVKAQLMQIDERSMVFLPKIEELIIRDQNTVRSYRKLEDRNGDVLVSATVDGVCTEYLWRVFKQERKTVTF